VSLHTTGLLLVVKLVALVLPVRETCAWCHDLLRAIVRSTLCGSDAGGSSCVLLLARTTGCDFLLLGMDAAHDTGKLRFCVV